MLLMDNSSYASIPITLKWRRKRDEMVFRPPPGGPIAANKIQSTGVKILLSFLLPKEWNKYDRDSNVLNDT